jgi:hypothetical protein
MIESVQRTGNGKSRDEAHQIANQQVAALSVNDSRYTPRPGEAHANCIPDNKPNK